VIFKLYNCDVGIKIEGVPYSFTHVQSVTIEDPEMNRITRGANAGNKIGIAYKEGTKDPKKITIPIIDMSSELKSVLDDAFQNQTRMEVYAIDRNDGSSKMGRNCVLCQIPQQLQIDETVESMNVSLSWETFDLSEVHKS
jgi:hypothetical protein